VSCTEEVRKQNSARIIELLSAIQYDNADEMFAHGELLSRFQQLRRCGRWSNTSTREKLCSDELLESMSDPDKPADLALVRALRRVTADFLRKHKDDVEMNEGISFDQICEAAGYEGVETFCKDKVLLVGEPTGFTCHLARLSCPRPDVF